MFPIESCFPVQQFAADRQQLVRTDRFLNQPVGAELIQRRKIDLHSGALDDEHDRRIGAGIGALQLAAQHRAVRSRKAGGDEDELGFEAAENRRAVGNGLGNRDLVPRLPQRSNDPLEALRMVVDDQDPVTHSIPHAPVSYGPGAGKRRRRTDFPRETDSLGEDGAAARGFQAAPPAVQNGPKQAGNKR